MAKPINIPNVFAAATSAIPLSQLDQDFSTLANATNDLATYSNYVADTGAANAFIANYPVNTNTGSLTTGLRLQFKAANANSGASTLNVQVNGASIGTASIRLTDGSALPANTIISGAMVDVMYDGTNFQLMNDPSGGQEVITNLTLSGNLTVSGTSNFTGNVTANVANTTTSTITNLSSGNVTITGGTISNVTLDNVTVDVETFSNITINGTASFADGTVSAPSITNTGDTNTGIFFPAADTIAFTEGGVESMRIDSSGNVGIGITPTYRLDVAQSGATTTSSSFAMARITGANATANDVALIGPNTSQVRIKFGDPDDANMGEVGYNNSNNAMRFNTNGSERMLIDSSGNVGIGTSSPDKKLVLAGSNDTSGENNTLKFLDTDTTTAAGQQIGKIEFVESDGGNETLAAYIQSQAEGTSGAGNLILGTGTAGVTATERMRIESGGRVLIGASTADLSGNGLRVITGGTTSGFAVMYGGTTGTFLGVTVENANGVVALDANARSGNYPPMTFKTSDAERMRITSSGSVLIGSTNNNAKLYVEQSSETNTAKLYDTNASSTTDGILVNVAARNTTNNTFYAFSYFNAGAGAYRFRVADSGNATNTNGSYGTISDAKLKENIIDATSKLDKVNQLQVRNYNFIGDELKQIGFVAQEFEQVFPSMVEESADKDVDGNDLGTTTKTIKTTVLIPILVKAIQELNAKVEAQAAEIALLKSK